MLKLLNFGYFTANQFSIKSDCEGPLSSHTPSEACATSRFPSIKFTGVNTTWAVLIFVTTHSKTPTPRSYLHQMPPSFKDLVPAGSGHRSRAASRPILLPGAVAAATETRWDMCDTRSNPPKPGLNQAVNCSMLSCRHVFLHSSRDLFLTGRKNHAAPDPNPTVTALERNPSPAKLLKMQHNLSELPSKTAGACISEADRKETRKHSGVLSTDYWTNRE